MGRKLPWNVSSDTTSTDHSQSGARATNSVSTPQRATRKESNTATNQSTDLNGRVPTDNKRRKISRTPSTSPPPDPPDVDLMHEGLDADDAYIMVEDEFQDVARSFTAHLHHAEYKRLMRNAKAARRAGPPTLSSQMSYETKLKLQKGNLSAKQLAGLNRMTGKPSIAETASEEDEEDIADLWAGTSLASLMTTGSQSKTSLKGLDRISTSTKAAQGYGPSTGSNTTQRNNHGLNKAPDSSQNLDTITTQQKLQPDRSKVQTDYDWTGQKKRSLDKDKRVHEGASQESESRSRKVRKDFTTHRSRIDELDDFDDDLFDRTNPSMKPLQRTTDVPKKASKPIQQNKSRLDEVPAFFV